MNQVRQRILLDVNESCNQFPVSDHSDLIAFCVCSDYFEDYEEVENGYEADFNELVVIVDKNWLFSKMEAEGIANPRLYLQEEYTTEDSGDWFDEANGAHQIMMVAFN